WKDNNDNLVKYLLSIKPSKAIENFVNKFNDSIIQEYWESIEHFPNKEKCYFNDYIDNCIKYNNYLSAMRFVVFNHKEIEFEKVIDVCEKFFDENINKDLKNSINKIDYYSFEEILKYLRKIPEVDKKFIFKLEIKLFQFIHDKKDLILWDVLSEDPKKFIEIIKIFCKDDDVNITKNNISESLVNNIYTILTNFKKIPGLKLTENNNYEIDEKIFNKWIDEYLKLAKDLKYTKIAFIKLGELLSHCPEGYYSRSEVNEDKIWPHPCISKILENGDQEIRESFIIGVKNNRGFYNPGNEYEIAKKYKNFAEKNKDFPEVKKILMKLSKDHEKDYKKNLDEEENTKTLHSI
ncbi:MAG: hypothetical protein P8N25_05860, partial [Alphaproteobacteria bacterium]|nr:hypothetical protein [Alphaproteobacteria bacterium]